MHNLETFINHRLAMSANSLRRLAYRLIAGKGLDITPEQWVILYYLWRKDGLPLNELVRLSQKDFANVSRIIEKLCANGYIEKRKSEEDHRSHRVFLLPRANEIKAQVEACWEEAHLISLKGMAEEEQRLLLSLMMRLEENVKGYLEH